MFDLASKFKNLLVVPLICFPLWACASSGAENRDKDSGPVPESSQPQSPSVAEAAKQEVKAKPDKKTEDPLNLAAVESRYAKATSVRMSVRKALTLKLLDQRKELEGQMVLKRPGRLFLEFTKPERSIAAITPKSFMLIQFPVDDFDSTIRVTRSRDMKRIQSQHLMAVLMGRGSILKEFRVHGEKRASDSVDYELRPKSKDHDVRELRVKVTKNDGMPVIQSLSFVDQLENKTELLFEKVEFNVEVSNKIFQPEIPKGAEVTEI